MGARLNGQNCKKTKVFIRWTGRGQSVSFTSYLVTRVWRRRQFRASGFDRSMAMALATELKPGTVLTSFRADKRRVSNCSSVYLVYTSPRARHLPANHTAGRSSDRPARESAAQLPISAIQPRRLRPVQHFQHFLLRPLTNPQQKRARFWNCQRAARPCRISKTSHEAIGQLEGRARKWKPSSLRFQD